MANLLAPWAADETRNDNVYINAPASFVRQKVLDYDFISDLQISGIIDSVDALRLFNQTLLNSPIEERPEHQPLTSRVHDAIVGDLLVAANPANSRPRRVAKVLANLPSAFIFEERRFWLGRIEHALMFMPKHIPEGQEPLGPVDPKTLFMHRQLWEGTKFALVMRNRGWMMNRFGEGLLQNLEKERGAPLKNAVEEAWKEEQSS